MEAFKNRTKENKGKTKVIFKGNAAMKQVFTCVEALEIESEYRCLGNKLTRITDKETHKTVLLESN